MAEWGSIVMELKAEVEGLLDGYYKWLKKSTKLESIDDVVAITTPNLDRHNDFMQLVVKRTESGYRLSDDGYVLADLEASGCLINSPKREAMLAEMLNGFGVKKQHDEFFVHASERDFALKKHSLMQAMLAVNDMFYVASPHVRSFFMEEVKSWLDENKIRSVRDSKFAGKSGYDHKFDFVIPSFEEAPERLLKTINNPNKQTAMQFIMAWEDVKPARRSAKAFAVINNEEKKIGSTVTDALRNYSIIPIPWSKRNEFSEDLAA